jgi:hypothetical protein
MTDKKQAKAGSFDKLRTGSSTALLAMRLREAPLRMTAKETRAKAGVLGERFELLWQYELHRGPSTP